MAPQAANTVNMLQVKKIEQDLQALIESKNIGILSTLNETQRRLLTMKQLESPSSSDQSKDISQDKSKKGAKKRSK